jgi:hypothetical protein
MKVFPVSKRFGDVMPQIPKTCSTMILWGALALGFASSFNAFAAKKIIPLEATPTKQAAEDVIYQMARVPTSNASTYLKNLTCANGVFGREIRYTIVKGSLAGHSKKQLFIRTYQTDVNGYMRPWSTDNYRWHPFNAGPQDTQEQYIELPAPNCDTATHIETSIVRNQRKVPVTIRCIKATCSTS